MKKILNYKIDSKEIIKLKIIMLEREKVIKRKLKYYYLEPISLDYNKNVEEIRNEYNHFLELVKNKSDKSLIEESLMKYYKLVSKEQIRIIAHLNKYYKDNDDEIESIKKLEVYISVLSGDTSQDNYNSTSRYLAYLRDNFTESSLSLKDKIVGLIEKFQKNIEYIINYRIMTKYSKKENEEKNKSNNKTKSKKSNDIDIDDLVKTQIENILFSFMFESAKEYEAMIRRLIL